MESEELCRTVQKFTSKFIEIFSKYILQIY